MTTTTFISTKLAWQLPGKFRCDCGETIPCPVFGQREPVRCGKCGTVRDGYGWLLDSDGKRVNL